MDNKATRLVKKTAWLGGAAAVAMILGVGCEAPNWEDPAYVSQQLLEGDANKRSMALQKLKELPDEQKVAVVPALAKLYLEGGSGQKDAMTQLVQLRHADGKDAYLAEMKSNAVNYGGASAEALGVAQAKDAIPEMLNVLKSTDAIDVKEGILRGFSYMPDPQVVSPLVDILKLDVDNHPIALHSYACDILGQVGQTNPTAFDDDAKETLVRAVYLANNKGQNLGRECGLAVQQLGPAAVPALLKTFKGENDGVQTLLMQYNRPPNFDFPENHARLVATIRLTGLRAAEAVEPFIEELKKVKAAPDNVKGQHAVAWRMKEAQGLDEIIMGLGDIGDVRARPILEEVLLGQRNDDWDDITDGLIELQLRQDAAQALNRLGDREALPALMKMAREGVIIDLERRFAILEKRGQPASLVERYQFNWMAAQAYANLATAEHLGEYKKLIDATKEKELKEKYESFLPMFEVAKACGSGDAKAQAKCYGEKLTDENNLVREKAVFELSRLPAEAAGPVLVANLDSKFMDTRELLTFALYRVPHKDGIGKIDAVLESEANRTGSDYKRDHNRLRMLKAWLAHQSL